jgi:hypothetical protein
MTDFLSEVKKLDVEANKNYFIELSKVNVNEMTERKGKFTYLSWSHAVSELLKRDPQANWTYQEPTEYADGSMMVYCTVYAFGIYRTAQLPVLDGRNNAIQNPNAMQVNTAMQRALAKAISLHGLGLYLYQGEDLPQVDAEPLNDNELLGALEDIHNCESMDALKVVYKKCYEHFKAHKDALEQIVIAKDLVKERLTNG